MRVSVEEILRQGMEDFVMEVPEPDQQVIDIEEAQEQYEKACAELIDLNETMAYIDKTYGVATESIEINEFLQGKLHGLAGDQIGQVVSVEGIKEALSNAFKKIMELITTLINKIIGFFKSKTPEKKEKEFKDNVKKTEEKAKAATQSPKYDPKKPVNLGKFLKNRGIAEMGVISGKIDSLDKLMEAIQNVPTKAFKSSDLEKAEKSSREFVSLLNKAIEDYLLLGDKSLDLFGTGRNITSVPQSITDLYTLSKDFISKYNETPRDIVWESYSGHVLSFLHYGDGQIFFRQTKKTPRTDFIVENLESDLGPVLTKTTTAVKALKDSYKDDLWYSFDPKRYADTAAKLALIGKRSMGKEGESHTSLQDDCLNKLMAGSRVFSIMTKETFHYPNFVHDCHTHAVVICNALLDMVMSKDSGTLVL